MLIAIARAPVTPDALAGAARLAGITTNDVTRRLTGLLPRVLLPAVPAEQAENIRQGLETLGFVALACDAAAVPTDDDRIVARSVEFRDREVVFGDGRNQYPCPAQALALIQRGMRSSMVAEKVHTAERRFDLGKAVLTGGLAMTSTARSTEHRQREHREAMLLLQRSDGEPDIALYERRIDYRFLGTNKAPASVVNLDLTLTQLRTVAPAAALDDRAMRPGFVTGLPLTSIDRLDLAFFLVSLARTRGC
jgi:hypothetical protein